MEPGPVTQRLLSSALGSPRHCRMRHGQTAHWELAASPALRQARAAAVTSHESEGQLWVVSIFLCEAIELFECISGQEQRVGEAAADVTDGPPRGILHVESSTCS